MRIGRLEIAGEEIIWHDKTKPDPPVKRNPIKRIDAAGVELKTISGTLAAHVDDHTRVWVKLTGQGGIVPNANKGALVTPDLLRRFANEIEKAQGDIIETKRKRTEPE